MINDPLGKYVVKYWINLTVGSLNIIFRREGGGSSKCKYATIGKINFTHLSESK
jgi:hypothetical protein